MYFWGFRILYGYTRVDQVFESSPPSLKTFHRNVSTKEGDVLHLSADYAVSSSRDVQVGRLGLVTWNRQEGAVEPDMIDTFHRK